MTNGNVGGHRQREDHRAMSNEIRITVTLIAGYYCSSFKILYSTLLLLLHNKLIIGI